MKVLNITLAVAFHCLVGVVFLVASQYMDMSDAGAGIAALLWFGGLFLMLEWREKKPGAIWLVPILWPFAAWFTALGVIVLIAGLVWIAIQSRQPAALRTATGPQLPDAYERKLRAVESTLVTLEAQLRDLLTQPQPAPVAVPRPAPAAPAPPRPATLPSSRPALLDREIDWSDFLGARALAWAGGVVTVLGVVFFFVLAANRGWLLPELRLALGATTSTALFGAGFWLRKCFGSLHSAVAAAGAGIAGAYATLLAATALYEFISQPWALVAAAGIATVGAATALAWSSQTVAGLGLLGAIVVPLLAVVEDGELSFVGTAFVAVMLIATAVVSLRTGWRDILLLAGAASLIQIAGLAAQTDSASWRVFSLTSAFWLLYLGIGLSWQLLRGRGALESVAGVFVITGGALAIYACLFLLDDGAGFALLGVGGLYTVLAAGFFRLAPYRELASVLAAVASVVAAIAAGELLAGASLTFVWCAVAVLLAWLARRTGESRLLLPALAYAVLGTGYALAVDAPPWHLFSDSANPGSGALGIVAASASVALLAFFARGPGAQGDAGSQLGRAIDETARFIRSDLRGYLWTAGALLLYAVSLGVLELFTRVSDFEWGHVALAGLWASVGVALVASGFRLGRGLDIGGLALLAATTLEVVAFDSSTLPGELWGTSFLLTAGAAALAGLEYGRMAPFAYRLVPAGLAAGVGALLAVAGIEILADGNWHGISTQGGALALAAAAYGALAFPVCRSHRDLSTVYWSLSLAIGSVALSLLVADFWLVLAGAAASAALAYLGRRTAELRLELAGVAAFAVTAVYALASQARLADLFTATLHPAAGAPSVLVLVGAAAAGAFTCTRRELRLGATWLAGALLLYAASLGVLELFVWLADFDWGHVALAAMWSVVGLTLLEAGLRRPAADLQIASLTLLIFAVLEAGVYDWVELPHTRAALALLPLAAALLAAGVEFGRLADVRERLLAAGLALTASAALAAVALVTLADGTWHGIDVEGGVFLLLGLVYAAIAAGLIRRERDLATCLWGIGLGFATVGLGELVSGFWLVLASSLLAVGIYVLGEFVREPRLQLAGGAVYVLTNAYAIAFESPPRDFFVESGHPGAGVPALLVLAGTAGIIAWRPEPWPHLRTATLAIVGATCFYAVSLALLELAEVATDADVATKFQRGHTAVSLFWGLVSLGFLYVGLTRRNRRLRAAGFLLFGVSLAKLFLYDLAFLSSLTRALSFLAVGAVLLFAGFFYQRLSEQLEGRGEAGRPA